MFLFFAGTVNLLVDIYYIYIYIVPTAGIGHTGTINDSYCMVTSKIIFPLGWLLELIGTIRMYFITTKGRWAGDSMKY